MPKRTSVNAPLSYRLGKSIIVCLGVFFLHLHGGQAWAQSPWRVLSQYTNPLRPASLESVTWEFSQSADEPGTVVVEAENGQPQLRLSLRFDNTGRLVSVVTGRKLRGQWRTESKEFDPQMPALLPRGPAPGDCLNLGLPFQPLTEEQNFSLRSEVGGVGFTVQARLFCELVDYAEATAAGLINADIQTDPGLPAEKAFSRLRLISLADNQLMLEQLWRVGDDFWLSEVRKNRRSWRYLK